MWNINYWNNICRSNMKININNGRNLAYPHKKFKCLKAAACISKHKQYVHAPPLVSHHFCDCYIIHRDREVGICTANPSLMVQHEIGMFSNFNSSTQNHAYLIRIKTY